MWLITKALNTVAFQPNNISWASYSLDLSPRHPEFKFAPVVRERRRRRKKQCSDQASDSAHDRTPNPIGDILRKIRRQKPRQTCGPEKYAERVADIPRHRPFDAAALPTNAESGQFDICRLTVPGGEQGSVAPMRMPRDCSGLVKRSFGTLALTPIALASMLVGFSGCAVGPNFQPAQPPPVSSVTSQALKTPGTAAGEHQTFSHGADIPADWWTLYRSPPLNSLIVRALSDNSDLAAAQAALRAANATVQAQRGFFFPTIDANYSPTRQKVSSSVLVPSTPTQTPYFTLQTAQLTVTYAPDVFGGNRRQVEALQAQADVQRFQLEATYLTLTSNIVLGAIQEASLREQIAATHKIIKIERELLELVQRRYNAGQVGLLDLAAQKAALAQSEQTLPPLETALARQRDALIALSGHFSGEGLPERFEFSSLRLPAKLPVSLPSAIIQQRPDVRAAEANWHAATAHVGVAIANRLPQFNINGTNVGRQSASFVDFFVCGPTCTFWTIAGSATERIFDGFTLEQQQRAAEAGLDQAAAQYRSTAIGAFQNIADALQVLEGDAKTLRAAEASATAAELSLTLTRRQLELGQVNVLEVLTVQNTYQQAIIAKIQAKANRYADTAALFQASGGGWWNRSDVNADEGSGW
ncbi:efflux transporter outer membrane subunit [Hyphomicrobium sp.]|uniref:efflux transporter outer membrane subunit n=1 Tax=Hyphomicrobium sp. TaxID=82 RepID=UPI0025C59F60|nr:efflux transporter outer membrane subunit [Hyphomicrobium sp.]